MLRGQQVGSATLVNETKWTGVTTVGLFKQLKDAKDMVNAAPGMVAQAQQMAAQAQQMAAAQQAAMQAQMAHAGGAQAGVNPVGRDLRPGPGVVV
jgi:hypothetical protein